MNLIDVVRELGTEAEGFAFFERMRWPDGIIRCTTCGNDRISRITRKSTTKNVRKNLYQCLEKTCKQQFSVTSGTIFHDTRIPLTKWFMAISLIMDAKKGISAKQLQGHLGLGSYQTAWHMAHRIREAMAEDDTPLSGVVEIDETVIGGTAQRRFGRAKEPKPAKEIVLAMRERNTKEKPGRVRYFHIPNAKQATIQPLIDKHVSGDVAAIFTDAASVYDFSINEDHRNKHRAVNHSIQWIVPGTIVHTNSVESAFSLLKRGLIGSFHRVSIKHLSRYLWEFETRFNQRKAEDRFSDMVMRVAKTAPLTYRRLVGEPVA